MSKFQIGKLQCPEKSDPTFNDYREALAEAEKKSIDGSLWAVWASQEEGSELVTIIYDGETYLP